MPTNKPSAQAESDEPKIERRTAQRKAAIILDVLKVKISVPEACRKYGFPQGEFREWAEEYHSAGNQDRRARHGKRDPQGGPADRPFRRARAAADRIAARAARPKAVVCRALGVARFTTNRSGARRSSTRYWRSGSRR